MFAGPAMLKLLSYLSLFVKPLVLSTDNAGSPPNANFPARNSRPVIAGFVRPTWERVPLKFPWINTGLGDFFQKNPDTTWGVESSVRTLWAVRRTDLWMVGLIPWSAMRSRCHLHGWPTDSRDEPIPAHLTAKFTSWILILLGRRSFPFGCPAFFFFSYVSFREAWTGFPLKHGFESLTNKNPEKLEDGEKPYKLHLLQDVRLSGCPSLTTYLVYLAKH